MGVLPPARPQVAIKNCSDLRFARLADGLQADVYLRSEKARDGYWTGERFLEQANIVYVSEVRRRGEKLVLNVDHSSNHECFGEHPLRTSDMAVRDNQPSAAFLRNT